MLAFAWPWLLAVLPIPIVIYLFLPAAKTSQAALLVPFFDPISTISQHGYQSGSMSKIIWLAIIWALVVSAATRPQWVGQPTTIPVSGRDLMLAVDISGSMKEQDMINQGVAEDRLTAVKRVAQKFIENRVGDRVGLILFGTRAYLQAPLSFDRITVNTLLQEAVIGIAGEKTAIGDAIGLALKRLREHYAERDEAEKVLILMTDGANTAGTIDPLKAAELSKTANLKIYTIGVGADKLLVNDIFGQRVIRPSTGLDEGTLSAMATLTGGRYFRALDVNSLDDIYNLIDELEPAVEDSKHLRPTIELFYLPLIIAAVLAMLITIIIGKLFNLVPRRLLPTTNPGRINPEPANQ